MATKKKVRSLRIDPVLDKRITSYAASAGMKESDAVRDLLEKGLACESLSVFATPVGKLVRDVIEAEFNLLREDMDSRNDALEERVARVCSRGTKASLLQRRPYSTTSPAPSSPLGRTFPRRSFGPSMQSRAANCRPAAHTPTSSEKASRAGLDDCGESPSHALGLNRPRSDWRKSASIHRKQARCGRHEKRRRLAHRA